MPQFSFQLPFEPKSEFYTSNCAFTRRSPQPLQPSSEQQQQQQQQLGRPQLPNNNHRATPLPAGSPPDVQPEWQRLPVPAVDIVESPT